VRGASLASNQEIELKINLTQKGKEYKEQKRKCPPTQLKLDKYLICEKRKCHHKKVHLPSKVLKINGWIRLETSLHPYAFDLVVKIHKTRLNSSEGITTLSLLLPPLWLPLIFSVMG